MAVANRSRASISNPLPSILTHDSPGPMEYFWGKRLEGTHVIPPDELTVRKGLRIFDQMRATDETVSYGSYVKRMIRLSTGWTLDPPRDDDGEPIEGAEAVLDHVQEQLERWDRFEEFLDQMLDGLRQGVKLAEIVTKEGRIGGKQSWVIDDCLVRNSRFFAFDVDDAGRLKPKGIMEWTRAAVDLGGISPYWDPAWTEFHPTEKFVKWSWNPEDCNAYSHYGWSDYRAVYRLWFLKDVMLKGWGETLDTYKTPIPLAVARNGLTVPQREDFLQSLQIATKKKALVVPEEYLAAVADGNYEKVLRFHEVTGKCTDFHEIAEYCDKGIMRGLMIGSLVADTPQGGKGSYALGSGHISIFLKVMDRIGNSLGRALRQTLFAPMIRWNLGEDAVDLAPRLKWGSAGDSEAGVRAEIIKSCVEAGIVDPLEPWIREYVGKFPDAGADLQEIQALKIDGMKKGLKDGSILPDGTPKKEVPEKKPGALSAEEEGRPGSIRRPFPEIEDLEAKLDLDSILAAEHRRRENFATRLNLAWGAIFRGPGGLAAQAAVALRNRRADIPIRIEPAAVVEIHRQMAVHTFVEGAVDADLEVDRGPAGTTVSEFAAEQDSEVLALDLRTWAAQQGVDLEEELARLAETVHLPQGELDAFARGRIAAIRDDIAQQVSKLRAEYRGMIVAAKSRGVGVREFLRTQLAGLEEKWAAQGAGLAAETGPDFETLENSVYNEGRVRMYERTSAVIGYLYSAVRDDRTTVFCRSWDGFQAPKSDPVWRTIVPPNHWRCRSTIIAILQGERTLAQLEMSSRRKPGVQPQHGFVGTKFVLPVAGRR